MPRTRGGRARGLAAGAAALLAVLGLARAGPVVQHQAPGFAGTAVMPDGSFKDISLGDFAGKWLVLFFYPLDFTFVCPTEITAFSDRVGDFREIGAEVVGVSVDSKFSHLAWSKQARSEGGLGGCQYPLLADITKAVAREYGVLIEEGPDAGVALRGLFIISPSGVLRQMTVNDLPVGRSVDETLRLLRAFQHTDEHGEVCPANWQPGAPTMIDDPEKSLEYFSKHG